MSFVSSVGSGMATVVTAAPHTFLSYDYVTSQIQEGTDIYVLEEDGRLREVNHEDRMMGFDPEKIVLIAKEKDLSSVPCTHDLMTAAWNESEDRSITLARGHCSITWEEDVLIFIQKGAARFGSIAGCSVREVLNCMGSNPSPFPVSVKCARDEASHQWLMTLDVIFKIAEEESPVLYLAAGEPLTPAEHELFKEIREFVKNPETQESMEQCHRQATKPYKCLDCGLSKAGEFAFSRMNDDRSGRSIGYDGKNELPRPAYACFGCSELMNWTGDCSLVTCRVCHITSTTCAFCVDGATGLPHDLVKCTNKVQEYTKKGLPFPLVLHCACPSCE